MSTLFQSKVEPNAKQSREEYTKLTNPRDAPRLLAISFSYPPKSEPRAIQVSRLLKHLNLPTVLVCEGEQDRENNASSILGDTESALRRTLRVPFPTSVGRDFLNRLSHRVYIPLWSRTPDHLGPWKRPVITTIERFISVEGYRPDVFATFAFPLIDNIIGLELKQRLRLPWIAHFSDPWVDSPFRMDDRVTKALNQRLEQKVVESADRLVFTSYETARLVMKKYSRALSSKVRIVPHAYEPDLFQDSKDGGGPFVIRYLGDLYSGRTPRPLFEGLEILSKSEPQLLKRFCFEIVGDIHNLNLEKMGISNLPEGLVKIRPRVDYGESLSLMTSASGLMVIDAPVPVNSESVFLPSKLIEYIGAGRPIIGLTPAGTASSLISRLGGWVADPASTREVAEAVRQFLIFILEQQENGTGWGRSDVRQEFEAGEVANQFKAVITELF